MDSKPIFWHLHLKSSPALVYDLLAQPAGRARFWAESAEERDGIIHFIFPGGATWDARILEKIPSRRFKLVYYGDSITTFELVADSQGGTDLSLTDENVPQADINQVTAGWVSVLMALKATVDYDIDLRNHDPIRTWSQGYADN